MSITIFEEWSNNQINNLNESNPNLLDDDVEIDIFNPEAIGFEEDMANNLAQYLFMLLEGEEITRAKSVIIDTTLSSYMKYSEQSKRLITLFSKLTFKEKIDTVSELLMKLEAGELLDIQNENYSNVIENGYEIVSLIEAYKKDFN